MISYLDLWAVDLIFFDAKRMHEVHFKKPTTITSHYFLYYDGFNKTYDSDLTLYPKHITIKNKAVNLNLQFYSTVLKKPILIDPQLMFDIELGFHPVNALQYLIQRNKTEAFQ